MLGKKLRSRTNRRFAESRCAMLWKIISHAMHRKMGRTVSLLVLTIILFIGAKVLIHIFSENLIFRKETCPLCRAEIECDDLFPVAAVEVRENDGSDDDDNDVDVSES